MQNAWIRTLNGSLLSATSVTLWTVDEVAPAVAKTGVPAPAAAMVYRVLAGEPSTGLSVIGTLGSRADAEAARDRLFTGCAMHAGPIATYALAEDGTLIRASVDGAGA